MADSHELARYAPDRCARCIPWKGRYQRGEEHLLPEVWMPLSAHPRWSPVPWISQEAGVPVIAFCPICESLWYVLYDRNEDAYLPSELPPGIDTVLRTDGRLGDVWPLVAMEGPAVKDLISSYFSHAEYDHELAARIIITRIAAQELSPWEAARLVYFLRGVVFGRRPKRPGRPIRISSLAPLIALLTRDDVWSDGWDTAYDKVKVRDFIDDIATTAFGLASGRASGCVRTRDVDRDTLLPMVGPTNRRRRAAERLERAVGDGRPGRAREALVDFDQVAGQAHAPLAPSEIEGLVRVLAAMEERACDEGQGGRWSLMCDHTRAVLTTLWCYERIPAACADLVREAIGRDDLLTKREDRP